MEMGIILGENLKKILIIPTTVEVEKFLFFSGQTIFILSKQEV